MTSADPSPRRVVIKVGGAVLDDPMLRARLASSVVAATANEPSSIVVIHGGGAQLSRQCERLGLDVQRNERGLRITDNETLKAALQVLGGEVNAEIVQALVGAGARAIGLTGADGGVVTAQPIDESLGAVGEVTNVDGEVLDDLARAGFIPVLATVVPGQSAGGEDCGFLNVNADAAVAPIAEAFRADAVLFLSDVAAVLEEGRPVPYLDAAMSSDLEASGTLTGGMIPKVEAALAASQALPSALVKIASGTVENAVVEALESETGTRFLVQVEDAHHGV